MRIICNKKIRISLFIYLGVLALQLAIFHDVIIGELMTNIEQEVCIESTSGYIVDGDNYIVENEDPQLNLSGQSGLVSYIKVELNQELESKMACQVYYAMESEGFSDEHCLVTYVQKGATAFTLEIPEAEYSSLRVDIGSSAGQTISIQKISIGYTQWNLSSLQDNVSGKIIFLMIQLCLILIIYWCVAKSNQVIPVINKVCTVLENLDGKRFALVLGGLSVLVFSPFIFGDYLMVYTDINSDTAQLYLPIYEMVCNKIQMGQLAIMDFTNGQGISTIGAIGRMCDPFSWIPVGVGLVFGVENLAYGLVYMQLAKVVVAGCACRLYVLELKYSERVALVSGIVYALSSFMLGAGQHYAYATFPVIFILILLFAEKAEHNRKYYIPMVLVIMDICLMSPYMALMVLLGYAGYVMLRQAQLGEQFHLWSYVKNVLMRGGIAVIGVLLSAVLFVPTMIQIMAVSNRVTEESTLLEDILAIFKTYNWSTLKIVFSRLFSENILGTGGSWNEIENYFEAPHLFLSCLLVVAIPQCVYILMKKAEPRRNKVIKIILIIVMIMQFTNHFLNYAFTLFTDSYFRHAFVFLPLGILVIAELLKNLETDKYYTRMGNILVLYVSLAFLFSFYADGSDGTKRAILISAFFLLFYGILIDIVAKGTWKQEQTRIFLMVIIAGVILQMMLDGGITLYEEREILTKEELNESYHEEELSDTITMIDAVEEDNFYRLEVINSSDVWFSSSLYYRYRSVSGYSSVVNGNTIEFMVELGDSEVYPHLWQSSYNGGSYGEVYDGVMADILGIKYIVAEEEYSSEKWMLIETSENYYVYENTDLSSVGLLYDTYILEESYHELSEVEQEEILEYAVILNELPIDFTSQSIAEYDTADTDIAGYTNEGIFFENKDYGNVVEGTVISQEEQLLLMAIPYEIGWSAYVDGEEVEILEADFGFSAIVISEGEHEVQFVYEVPGWRVGIMLSGIGALIGLGAYIRRFRYGKDF